MNKVTVGFAVAALGVALAPQVMAETVLLEKTTLVSGHQSFVYEMQAPSAGTLNVTLSNIDWPTRLSSLSFAASSATSMLQPLSNANASGLLAFSVDGPGAYYAHVAGIAAGALELGLFSLRVTFDPLVSPVPLPAAAWLLLAGFGAFAGAFRGRTQPG